MGEEDIVKKVFLLAVLTKAPDESLQEVTRSLANTGMFKLEEGQNILEELKRDQYIINEQLSVKGIAVAKAAEAEFKIH